jgi:uncharacterized protein (TIGR02284 family)
MTTDKSIDVLNSLIVINNDRIQGYETALEETKDSDLMSLFNRFIEHSRQFRDELIAAVAKLGGEPAEGTRIDGKIYRAWMDFKALVTGKDRKAILNSCEYGEDVAVNTYEKAMKDEDLAGDYAGIVSEQYSKIKADHDQVRGLRDSA